MTVTIITFLTPATTKEIVVVAYAYNFVFTHNVCTSVGSFVLAGNKKKITPMGPGGSLNSQYFYLVQMLIWNHLDELVKSRQLVSRVLMDKRTFR